MSHRLLSLDLVKIVSMFCVICLHTEMYFLENPAAQFCYMTAVVAIPMFFMTSGYLLLGKQSVDWRYSSLKNWGIFRFVAIITIAYWFLTGIRHGVPFLTFTLGSLFQKGRMGIFWYFGAMIIIYALLPILHRLFVNHPKVFKILTIVLGLFANIIFIANFWGVHIEINTIQTFRLWNWLFYFNVGGLIRIYRPKIAGSVVLALFIINFLFQYILTPLMPSNLCEFFYSSVIVMALSVALFSYLLNIDESKLKNINGGGKFFLPVYTFHMSILGNTEKVYEQYIYSVCGYTAPLFWIFVSILTILFAWMVLKIPYMDKVFRI